MYVDKQVNKIVIDNGDYLFDTFQWLDVIQLLATASAEHIDIYTTRNIIANTCFRDLCKTNKKKLAWRLTN